MKDAGLFDGDRVIIDRAVEPHDGSIVVAWWDGGFTMKFLDLTHTKDGYIELRPANDDYPVFRIDDPNEFQVWGVVIHLIRTFENIQFMYGIIDCDNCYVSCERVFRPDLEGKPVVVLSNNDGCVVARSNEAKKMGIKAGTPYFQLAQQFPNQKIAVFSSNYELYGELTGRIVSLISQEVPAYFRYSIDECFVYLDGMEHLDPLNPPASLTIFLPARSERRLFSYLPNRSRVRASSHDSRDTEE